VDPLNETVNKQVDCPVLGSMAHITITYRVYKALGYKTEQRFDCEQCHDCGVAILSPSGMNWSFNWDICPFK